jgi:hypothetical protein
MSQRRPDGTDPADLVGDLARTVEELQTELGPRQGPPLRPPSPRDLARFTSEVTIPAIVLALETNVRALKLLQRTLRLATGEDPRPGAGGSAAHERAEALGRETLSRLDDALADLQDALEGRPPEDPARELLDEARSLRAEIDERMAASESDLSADRPAEGGVDVDVESELQSIKDDLDDDGDGTGD